MTTTIETERRCHPRRAYNNITLAIKQELLSERLNFFLALPIKLIILQSEKEKGIMVNDSLKKIISRLRGECLRGNEASCGVACGWAIPRREKIRPGHNSTLAGISRSFFRFVLSLIRPGLKLSSSSFTTDAPGQFLAPSGRGTIYSMRRIPCPKCHGEIPRSIKWCDKCNGDLVILAITDENDRTVKGYKNV